MLTYLINVTATWMILYIIYKWLLEKEKYFALNRFYLLSSVIFGLALPLLSFISIEETQLLPSIAPELNASYYEQLVLLNEYSSVVINTSTDNSPAYKLTALQSLKLVYLIGLCIALLRVFHSGMNLTKLFVTGRWIRHKTHIEVTVDKRILPFSFLNFIFISDRFENSDERSNILIHELYHVKSYHTIDVISLEVLKVIFWFHPMVYLYKRSIIQNHEYSADESVLKHSSRQQYCALLMQNTFPNVNLAMTNSFFQTYINKRITMMYQSKSKKVSLLKYSVALIAIVLMSGIFAKPIVAQIDQTIKDSSLPELSSLSTTVSTSTEAINNTDPVAIIKSKPAPLKSTVTVNAKECLKNDKGYYFALELPSRLPSCPDGVDGRDHYMPILTAFGEENFRWPAEAIEAGYQGLLYFSIMIDEKGNMGEVLTTDKRFPYGLQEEGMRIVDLMREEFSFLPGECNGAPVKTAILFHMRIRVPDDKRELIIVKDASNVTPNQNPTIHSVSNSGRMLLFYSSNMNVPTSLELLNPEGKVIFEDEIDYIYGTYHKEVILPQHDNGVYTMRATQSGQVKETRTDVTIF